ncbi:Transmembrane domain-containing protein [Spironucleus salmonicida]|uniref:Transmembrane domain-containing protein n=1 Tax=Spironucleus salmonicida TaxID=348837 RepID=A0A9P8LTF9_9EUKA|nr:Transmembrane domain-containing protein [Spironucleus salmonicida]
MPFREDAGARRRPTMEPSLAALLAQDRRLACLVFAVSLALALLGLLTLDFALVSLAGLVLQVGVVFFVGLGNFQAFLQSPEQKLAFALMMLGVLAALNHYVVVGSILEWGAFLYLFSPFRSLFKAVFRLVAAG